jgi:hypothetical protein
MGVSEAAWLRQMEDENRRLKQLVADLSLDKAEERGGVRVGEFGQGERTACKLLGVDRSRLRYEPRPDRNAELREELLQLARQKPQFGYRRLDVILERHG